jgi:hypothetical protein
VAYSSYCPGIYLESIKNMEIVSVLADKLT